MSGYYYRICALLMYVMILANNDTQLKIIPISVVVKIQFLIQISEEQTIQNS
jgi:hypothetical protein